MGLFVELCPVCEGRRRVLLTWCKQCHGRGWIMEEAQGEQAHRLRLGEAIRSGWTERPGAYQGCAEGNSGGRQADVAASAVAGGREPGELVWRDGAWEVRPVADVGS